MLDTFFESCLLKMFNIVKECFVSIKKFFLQKKKKKFAKGFFFFIINKRIRGNVLMKTCARLDYPGEWRTNGKKWIIDVREFKVISHIKEFELFKFVEISA